MALNGISPTSPWAYVHSNVGIPSGLRGYNYPICSMVNVDVNNWAILGGILLVNIPAPWSTGVRGSHESIFPLWHLVLRNLEQPVRSKTERQSCLVRTNHELMISVPHERQFQGICVCVFFSCAGGFSLVNGCSAEQMVQTAVFTRKWQMPPWRLSTCRSLHC